jgi:hypothetical protein
MGSSRVIVSADLLLEKEVRCGSAIARAAVVECTQPLAVRRCQHPVLAWIRRRITYKLEHEIEALEGAVSYSLWPKIYCMVWYGMVPLLPPGSDSLSVCSVTEGGGVMQRPSGQ